MSTTTWLPLEYAYKGRGTCRATVWWIGPTLWEWLATSYNSHTIVGGTQPSANSAKLAAEQRLSQRKVNRQWEVTKYKAYFGDHFVVHVIYANNLWSWKVFNPINLEELRKRTAFAYPTARKAKAAAKQWFA